MTSVPPTTSRVRSAAEPRIVPGEIRGSAALRTFAEDLFRQGHRTIIIDPDPANTRAVRAYEKAGFKAIPHLLGRTGDTLIMQYGPEQIDCAA